MWSVDSYPLEERFWKSRYESQLIKNFKGYLFLRLEIAFDEAGRGYS